MPAPAVGAHRGGHVDHVTAVQAQERPAHNNPPLQKLNPWYYSCSMASCAAVFAAVITCSCSWAS